jgi:hypothetical protein
VTVLPAAGIGSRAPVVIDHLAYAVPDLAAAVADLEARLGVRAGPGGKHVGLGTHNALLARAPLTYLEIIAPDPDQPAPAVPRGLSLEAFHPEHPDPPSLAGPLAALGADVEVRPAMREAMVAHVHGPTSRVTLT